VAGELSACRGGPPHSRRLHTGSSPARSRSEVRRRPKLPPATAATHATNRALTTPRAQAWAKLMARVGEEFPFARPGCGGDIRLIAFINDPGPMHQATACRSRPTSNRRFASGRRPGWLCPRTAAPPVSLSRSWPADRLGRTRAGPRRPGTLSGDG
jgi:hypothetical protein